MFIFFSPPRSLYRIYRKKSGCSFSKLLSSPRLFGRNNFARIGANEKCRQITFVEQ